MYPLLRATSDYVVLDSVMDAHTVSEQALSALILSQSSWAGWLLVADRNFGVWSVVAQAAHHRHHRQDVVVRLTRARAGRLVGGEKLPSGTDRAIQWSPTRHDQGAESTPRRRPRLFGRSRTSSSGAREHRFRRMPPSLSAGQRTSFIRPGLSIQTATTTRHQRKLSAGLASGYA